jgi:hypothetical protein
VGYGFTLAAAVEAGKRFARWIGRVYRRRFNKAPAAGFPPVKILGPKGEVISEVAIRNLEDGPD